MERKLKVAILSNYSRAVTGFGKAMKNICLALYEDPDIEIIEFASGVPETQDLKTPWKSCGMLSCNQQILQQIQRDPAKERANSYGYYCVDSAVEREKPDVIVLMEDIWAFYEYHQKPWWNNIQKICWTTLDSLPILPFAYNFAPQCDKLLTWATFAEEEMKKNGIYNVETLHGPIDFNNFFPLGKAKKEEIKRAKNIDSDFVIGFVFKNQLRKSVGALLRGFKKFSEKRKELKPKLLLHTDWSEAAQGWDIVRYLDELAIDKGDVYASYICKQCGEYFINQYEGEEKDCPACGTKKSVYTKTSSFGVTESQLNEIYNVMDVYCHPFTSGGQEIPIQEAKAAGLITLVTEYSCGTDSCYPEQGGLPLDWDEYREHQTQFIKAATSHESIYERLLEVSTMPEEMFNKFSETSRKYVIEEFGVANVIKKLKKILLEFKPVSWPEKKEAKQPTFDDYLTDEGKDNRIAVVIPESAGDVLMVNALLDNLSDLYKNDKIYVITKPPFFDMIEDHPKIHRMIPYQDGLDSLLFLEGQGSHQGFFKCAFLPFTGSQRFLNYMHNDKDKSQIELS